MKRLGAVSYLNTKPLIHGLRERLAKIGDWQIVFDLPSRLANQLEYGELDVALIPSFEFFRLANCRVLSDACIGCRGPVRSVKLLFNRPPPQIQSLALDEGSRTSAALAQVLLRQRFGISPPVRQLPIDSDFGDCGSDAVLVIGDRAMDVPDSDYFETWDLGEVWHQTTGLPFVFAMWVTPDNNSLSPLELSELANALEDSRADGLANARQIANQYHHDYAIGADDCLSYFTEQLHFVLSNLELKALDLFRRLSVEYGLLPSDLVLYSLQAK